jgi:3D (Asp-Asp-Asp) domain-containing protein
MAAPAAAPAAAKVARVAGRAAAARAARGRRGGDGGGPGWGTGLVLLLVLVPTGLVVGLVVLSTLLGGAQQQACSPGGGPLPGDFSGPGSLGGVGGTGIGGPLVEQVRSGSPYAGSRITPATYGTTAYGPPWGGIQGAGISTSGGLPIRGGAPRWYMIAVSPSLISHGTFVYIWPNPFGWKGPFFAADTGGAIVGNRIDFYDWRGRATQLRWGLRDAQVSARPIAASGGGAPDQTATQPVAAGPGSLECAGPGGGSLSLPGAKGKVTVAPGGDRPGMPTKRPVLDFLASVAGIAGRPIVVTTGSNHSQYTSSGYVSDHWIGMAADLGSYANGFPIASPGSPPSRGDRIAAASLRAAGVPEREAWRLAQAGGGYDVCYRGWRIQTIWRTGDHWDHNHIGLRRGCSFEGVQTFQI